ncbi:hypothetical protein [uncultured Hyphomonas sp.]|uniref:hypothetical protein n=1 Tax=uncultured Hyphomonas sp. TaxID=225298 RepID=UPI002AABADAA|nr:hypothetical protein [uncultured Hyphomonas sp.]
MLALVELSLVFAGLCGAVAGIYRFNTVETTRLRHHNNIVKYADLAARVRWVDKVHDILFRIEGLLDRFFGQPKQDRDRILNFLTMRAWKANASVVTFYMLVLPMGGGLAALVVDPVYSLIKHGTPSSDDWQFAGFGAFGLAALIWFVVRNARRNSRGGKAARDKKGHSALWEALAIIPGLFSVVVIFGTLGVMFPEGSGFHTVHQLVGFFLLLIVLLYSGLWVFRCIWRYGAYSPIVLSISMLLIFLAVRALLLGVWFLDVRTNPQAAGAFAQGNLTAYIFTLLAALQCAGAVLYFSARIWPQFLRGRFFTNPTRKFLILTASVTVCVSLIALISNFLVDEVMYASMMSSLQTDIAVSLFLLQLFLFIFSPIFANSVPDMLSVGFTRFCIGRAARSDSKIEMLKMLALDFLLAVGCVVMSLGILLIGGLVIVLIGEAALAVLVADRAVNWDEASSTEVLLYFGQILGAFLWISISGVVELVGGVFHLEILGVFSAEPDVFWDENILGVMRVTSFILLGMVLTSLIPTVVNAAIITFVISSHFIEIGVTRSAANVHGLLLEKDAYGKPIGIWRSTSLIGILGGSLCALLLFVSEYVL